MEPIFFLEEIVRPNVADQRANAEDFRHAFNAIATIDALAAHMYQWCWAHGSAADCGDDIAYRKHLAGRSDEFSLVWDIATARKHLELTRITPALTSIGQLDRRAGDFGTGSFGSGPTLCLLVRQDNGNLRAIGDVIIRALDFLEAEMMRRGM